MTIAAIQHRNDEFSTIAKPAGYVEYETRTSLRELIALYGIEGARLLVADIFSEEARRQR
jgi:hypothetical protein